MALDLFKKTAPYKGLFAVEKISLIYNLLTTLLILVMYQQMEQAGIMLIDRIVIASVTFLLMYLDRLAPCKVTTFVRIVVQMGLLAYWYPDTYEFNRFFPNLDHVFANAEQWLFNSQPALLFPNAVTHWWACEAFNMGYFAYYPMIFVVAMYFFIFRYSQFEKISFILVASFLIFYLIYIFVPVAGPQFYFPAIGMENVDIANFYEVGDYFNHNQELLPAPGYTEGFFYNLVEGSQQVGERPTAAFPSSHVGVSTLLMIIAVRENRTLFAMLLPFYLLLCCATVYIQAHYLIDALAGFVAAFILYFLTTMMYRYWFARTIFPDSMASSND